MRPDALAIFESRLDHVSWDKYDQQIELIDELSEDEKRRAKGGIKFLRGAEVDWCWYLVYFFAP